MKRNTIQITPFMHVENLADALAFMTDILGFSVTVRTGNFAYIEREGVVIRMLCEPRQFVPGNRRYAICIDVVDVDKVYAELKPKLDTLPEHHVRGPVDRPYASRELLVLTPDGNFLAFNQTYDNLANMDESMILSHERLTD
jgi:catechol 2,3-dioxygenase-like lactoylglutathione lyase family enzyme